MLLLKYKQGAKIRSNGKILNSHRVKCLTISSSLMFSGRFPTHKWRVSRTILFMNILSYLVNAIRFVLALKTAVKIHIFQQLSKFTRKAETSRFLLTKDYGSRANEWYNIFSDWLTFSLIVHRFIFDQWHCRFYSPIRLLFPVLCTRSLALHCQWNYKVCFH